MSINDLKDKNILADLHTDWEDKKAKFEYARASYDAASTALKAHKDYIAEATEQEKTEVVEYDSKLQKLDANGMIPKG